jgi:hypothetical protein
LYPLCLTQEVFPTPLCNDCRRTNRINYTLDDNSLLLVHKTTTENECGWCKRKGMNPVYLLSERVGVVLSRGAMQG